MKHTAIFLSLFFAILALTGLSCGLLDSEKIAGNLEDRLTNALDFDSGDVEDGPPPEENSGDDYPQIDALRAPLLVKINQEVNLDISTDFTDTDIIEGAIIWVDGAENHIVVRQNLTPEGTMRIEGLLENDPTLADNEFVLYVALLKDDGQSGQRVKWALIIPEVDEEDIDSDDPLELVWSCEDEGYGCSDAEAQQWVSTGQFGMECQADCDDTYPDGDVSDDGWKNCVYCCYDAALELLDHDAYVDCGTCNYVEDGAPEDQAIAANEGAWNTFVTQAANCVRDEGGQERNI